MSGSLRVGWARKGTMGGWGVPWCTYSYGEECRRACMGEEAEIWRLESVSWAVTYRGPFWGLQSW